MNEYNGIYKGRKVLLTGHTGFKGSWMSLLLHKLGADVYGYALEPPTKPSLYEAAGIDELVTSFIGDVRNLEQLVRVFKQVQPEIVLHMAAQPLVRDSYKIPVETYAVNVMGTVNVLEACRQTKSIKAIVNVTTDKCYDNKEWPWGYRENEPMGGYDPYSNSKGCSELVTASYRDSFFNPKTYTSHGVAIATARAGNVIGGGDWASDRLIPDFIRAFANNQQVVIRSPQSIRPWQHVLEPLHGYLTLAEKLFQEGAAYNGAWNFGPADTDAKNVAWIVQRLCDLCGGGSYVVDTNPQLHEAHYLRLDCSKAKAGLGWEPRWSLEKALEAIVVWNKAFHAKQDVRVISEQQIETYYSK